EIVLANTDIADILKEIFLCNTMNVQSEIITQIYSFFETSEIESAAKLFFNFQHDITDKKILATLKEEFTLRTKQLYATDSNYLECRNISILIQDKKLYTLLATETMQFVEKLIAEKKFIESGKIINEYIQKYPDSDQWKYVLRKWVIADYNENYIASEIGYNEFTINSNTEICFAGKLPDAMQQKFLQRLNYVRRIAGIYEPCKLDEKYNAPAQKAAFMMSANSMLSHGPPDTWKCYSKEGALGASHSNLSLGYNAVDALMGQVDDDGSGNESVGHRRWILNPNNFIFGHGSTYDAMALYVFGTDGDNEKIFDQYKQKFITWPPAGYCPENFITGRWSFSLYNADFSKATVELICNGEKIPLTILESQYGYGQTTLVWEISNIPWRFEEETTYTVIIKNVPVGYDDTPAKTFKYTVTFLPMREFIN
ncbi:MAG: hypothetical protein H7Y00_05890, partial [Fimbriimonadaceae bacterium]|nr:hypothetical protein [Chitinophagales bacterium]